MTSMDTTQPGSQSGLDATTAIEKLATADPAEAPAIAEELAAELSTQLESAGADH